MSNWILEKRWINYVETCRYRYVSFIFLYYMYIIWELYFYIICKKNFLNIKKFCYFRYLAVSGRVYGNPITGQTEVVGEYSSNSPHIEWMTTEGVFIHPNDFKAQHHIHTEL